MANPVPEEQAKKTFHTVFFVYVFVNMLTSVLPVPTVDSEGTAYYSFWEVFNLVISLLLLIWNIWALTKTRAHVRSKEQIPEEQCHGCEDLCCALFCSCCAVAQLYRHTEDMDSHCHPLLPPSNTPVVIEAVGIV
jgi:Cys-rich protein (TIGR01571 family)